MAKRRSLMASPPGPSGGGRGEHSAPDKGRATCLSSALGSPSTGRPRRLSMTTRRCRHLNQPQEESSHLLRVSRGNAGRRTHRQRAGSLGGRDGFRQARSVIELRDVGTCRGRAAVLRCCRSALVDDLRGSTPAELDDDGGHYHRRPRARSMTSHDDLDALRTENRRLLAKVHHLEVELRDAHERIAFLAQELDRVRQTLPRQGPSTS
jgi:hypothetical protein